MGAYGFDAIDLTPITSLVSSVLTRLGVPEAALTDFAGMIGVGSDAAGTAGTAGQSLHSKLRKALVDVAAVLTRIGTPEAALASLAGMVGKGDDAAGTMGVAGESLHAKLRALATLVASAGKTMRTTYIAAPCNPNDTADASPATDYDSGAGNNSATNYKILHILEHTPPTGGAWRDLTHLLSWDSQGAAIAGTGACTTKWMIAPSTNVDAVGDPPGPTASDLSDEFAGTNVRANHEVSRAVYSGVLPASGKVRLLLCGKVTTVNDVVVVWISNQCRLECTVEV